MLIATLDPQQLDAAAELAVHLNADPTHHIGYFGANAAEVRQHIHTLAASAATFVGAFRGTQLCGLLGVESDPELRRTWLHGPLIHDPDWQAIADALYAAGCAALPDKIAEHEIFCDVANERVLQFAAAHSFARYGDWQVLCFERAQLAGVAAPPAQPFTPAYREAVRQLHDQLFPTANMSSRQLIDGIGAHAQVFLCTADTQLLGYIALSVEPTSGEAFIDFLGVAEAARGLGIGGRLLRTGLHWLFAWPTVGQVCLTVQTENVGAERLYQRAGFRRERTLRALRRPMAAT